MLFRSPPPHPGAQPILRWSLADLPRPWLLAGGLGEGVGAPRPRAWGGDTAGSTAPLPCCPEPHDPQEHPLRVRLEPGASTHTRGQQGPPSQTGASWTGGDFEVQRGHVDLQVCVMLGAGSPSNRADSSSVAWDGGRGGPPLERGYWDSESAGRGGFQPAAFRRSSRAMTVPPLRLAFGPALDQDWGLLGSQV